MPAGCGFSPDPLQPDHAARGRFARIVVLKADRLYGDLIRTHIEKRWRNAQVRVFQLGFDALEAIQANMPDLFITGAKIADMDGLEHLEPFMEHALPILIVTSRKDSRTFAMLRELRFDGIYDGNEEGLDNLHTAMERVLGHQPYVSPSFAPYLETPKDITLDALTDKEQVVLSVIGDGSDDHQAAERLGLSPHTVNTHRKAIMGKLGLHQKGELMCYAVQNGYVHITPDGVYRPGFQRRIRNLNPPRSGAPKECAGCSGGFRKTVRAPSLPKTSAR
jgi:DNA-binding NarL/FixJ family response regulator